MAESAIVFDTATTLALVDKARTLGTHHLLGGDLAFSLAAHHLAPSGSAVSNAETLRTHHFEAVVNALTVTVYHMAGVSAPLTPSANTSVSRSFSIPVFEFGEDVGGTVDFTVE